MLQLEVNAGDVSNEGDMVNAVSSFTFFYSLIFMCETTTP